MGYNFERRYGHLCFLPLISLTTRRKAQKQRSSGIAINHQAIIPLERQYRRTRTSPHQPIGGASFVTKFVELLLNCSHCRIRSRARRCWFQCRQGTRGWAASESTPAFCLKLAPVRLNVSARALQSTAPVAEPAAATVVVSHHGIEPINIGVAVVVEGGLRALHADVFRQAIPNLSS